MNEELKRTILIRFGSAGFDRNLTGFEVLSMGDGRAQVRIPVGEAVANLSGNLHGGAIATLVDDVGTLAIMSGDRQGRPGVTTDLSVSYFLPGRSGEKILIDANVLKFGRTLAYVSVDLRREAGGTLIAQGRMTKFMGR